MNLIQESKRCSAIFSEECQARRERRHLDRKMEVGRASSLWGQCLEIQLLQLSKPQRRVCVCMIKPQMRVSKLSRKGVGGGTRMGGSNTSVQRGRSPSTPLKIIVAVETLE
jgi:hypothetical protein